jgi:hypothetical protein
MAALADLLGRLHTLAGCANATDRDAGSWHHLALGGGRRSADAAALYPLLEDAQTLLPHDRRSEVDRLLEELALLDDLTDLPQTLHHPDFGGPNAIRAPDGCIALVDWTGAGRCARVAGLAHLLGVGAIDLQLVDVVVAAYGRYVQPADAELERLPGAIRAFGLVLECWYYVFHGQNAAVVQQLSAERASAETIATRALGAFRELSR